MFFWVIVCFPFFMRLCLMVVIETGQWLIVSEHNSVRRCKKRLVQLNTGTSVSGAGRHTLVSLVDRRGSPSNTTHNHSCQASYSIGADSSQMGQIWYFLWSVSVHFGAVRQNVLKLIIKSPRIVPSGALYHLGQVPKCTETDLKK